MAAMQALTEKLNKVFASRRFNLIAFGIIAGLVLIAYSNTFTSSFHFDDNPSIVENATIKHVTMDNIITLLRGIRPVVNLSLMLNYALGGLSVVGYHIFNIAVHIANSMLRLSTNALDTESAGISSEISRKGQKDGLVRCPPVCRASHSDRGGNLYHYAY